ncbi:phage-related protein [Nocardioides cavernae]|uniref:Phage-related protein n=1 Tax=Nocardioides cavernae TaxID=1921566 RepID=A0A7Y9H316_9ACTN|nr:hypothetical protein [Nocardioides cavernae]NYE36279.1 phage-related protein [Nocardioides cavernae]
MSALVVDPGNTDRGLVTNFDSFSNGTNGLKMIDGAADSASAFARGDWIEGTINGVSAALDVVGAILNPLGTACSMVVNWILEHCGPIQDWLDELLGDPGVIRAGAESWRNIGDHMGGIGPDYRSLVATDTGGYTGLAMDAYRAAAGGMEHVFAALSQVAHGVSSGIEIAGGLLAGVRTFIEGLFSDLVGNAIGAVAQSALTLGIAAPAALTSLINKARSVLERCRKFMKALSESLDKMAALLKDISPALEASTKGLAQVFRSGIDMPTDLVINLGKGATSANNP